jgi:hypothetical protein
VLRGGCKPAVKVSGLGDPSRGPLLDTGDLRGGVDRCTSCTCIHDCDHGVDGLCSCARYDELCCKGFAATTGGPATVRSPVSSSTTATVVGAGYAIDVDAEFLDADEALRIAADSVPQATDELERLI